MHAQHTDRTYGFSSLDDKSKMLTDDTKYELSTVGYYGVIIYITKYF